MSMSVPAPGTVPQVTLLPERCCPVLGRPLSIEEAERDAALLRALADPVRLRLLSLIAAGGDGEACVCDLNAEFDLSQPTISHHLKVLHAAGLVERSKKGVWVHYSVRRGAFADLARLFSEELA
jgi:ArsR family transcriptional regulator